MSETIVTALDETWSAVRALLQGLGDDDWGRPTPCTEWDVRDLVAHLGALESQFQGLSEPDTPDDPTGGIDAWTAAGVVARRSWPVDRVVSELEEASALQVERLRALDADGWEATTFGPIGETTMRGLAELRLFDVYLHLLDLRVALDRPLAADGEPTAARFCIERALTLTPWGAVKKAGLPDGAHVRLDLDGLGGRTTDLVVDGTRGALVKPDGEASDRVVGTALAYTLLVTGREAMAESAGGVKASGDHATRLLDGYRIFA